METYEYFAFSDSTCETKLANVEFRTLALEGITLTVSVSDAQASEDGTRMQFWVSPSGPSREEMTVDVQASEGTAASGTDFKATSLTLTFPPNSSDPELLPVLVHDDQEPEPDETFTVMLTNPTDSTLGDAADIGTIMDDSDTGVVAVAVVSDGGADDTYALGDTIRVAVTFDAPVAVDTSGGTPALSIDMDPADWGVKRIACAGGSGTAELVFAHEVVEPNHSTRGIAVLADSLALEGGTIRTVADGADAALAHAGLGHDRAHRVDWTLAPEPNRAPVVDEGSRHYASLTAPGNALRGMLVTKPFDGIFSDPDGDALTYTVTLSDPGQAALVEMLHVLTAEELAGARIRT